MSSDASESCQPSVLSKGDSAVEVGEGVCATFLFEMPMGNASSLYNQPVASTASTAATSSSSSSSSSNASSSSSLLKPPTSQDGPSLNLSPHKKGSENNNNYSSSSSSSSSSSGGGKGNGKLLSYGQRAHRMQEDNEEAYKRQSRLCPSFTTSQQVSPAPHCTALNCTTLHRIV